MKIGLQTYGTRGDILPFITMASGLQEYGHEVTLVITTPYKADFTEYADLYDLNIIHASDDFCYENKPPAHKMTEGEIKEHFSLLDKFAHSEAEKLCKNNQLVIGNIGAHYLHAFAEIHGCKYATVSLEHATTPSKYKPVQVINDDPNIVKANLNNWLKIEQSFNEGYGNLINGFRGKLGLEPVNIYKEVTHSRFLHLIGVSEVFCNQEKDWENHRYVCGFFPPLRNKSENELPNDLLEFVKGDQAPIFFSIGSFSYFHDESKFIEIAISAAKLLKCKIVVQAIGDVNINEQFLSNNQVYFLKSSYDHRLIFPHCSVIVHHGGAGTTHNSVLSACPSVVVEFDGDTGFWAMELMRKGLAPAVIPFNEISVELLADRLKQVLSSKEMKVRAKENSELMKKEKPITKLQNAINEKFSIEVAINYCE